MDEIRATSATIISLLTRDVPDISTIEGSKEKHKSTEANHQNSIMLSITTKGTVQNLM